LRRGKAFPHGTGSRKKKKKIKTHGRLINSRPGGLENAGSTPHLFQDYNASKRRFRVALQRHHDAFEEHGEGPTLSGHIQNMLVAIANLESDLGAFKTEVMARLKRQNVLLEEAIASQNRQMDERHNRVMETLTQIKAQTTFHAEGVRKHASSEVTMLRDETEQGEQRIKDCVSQRADVIGDHLADLAKQTAESRAWAGVSLAGSLKEHQTEHLTTTERLEERLLEALSGFERRVNVALAAPVTVSLAAPSAVAQRPPVQSLQTSPLSPRLPLP